MLSIAFSSLDSGALFACCKVHCWQLDRLVTAGQKNCKTRRLLFVAVFNLPEEFIACFMNVYVCLGKAFCWAGGLFSKNVAALSCMHK